MYIGELKNEYSFIAVKDKKLCGVIVGTNNIEEEETDIKKIIY